MTAALTERTLRHRDVAVSAKNVRQALGAVLDPELDEPITDLGFVRSL